MAAINPTILNMLCELRIQNLLLVENETIQFKTGLTALTGETGAGKSILLSSLRLLAGDKLTQKVIGPFGPELRVEGTFKIAPSMPIHAYLESEGLPTLDEEIVLERALNQNGKSKCRVNGSLCNVQIMEHVCEALMDVHGQHQQQKLLQASSHLDFLDRYGNLLTDAEKVAISYRQWMECLLSRQNLIEAHTRNLEQRDFLRFQSEELQKAKLKVGEEEELEKKVQWLTQGSKIYTEVEKLQHLLDGETSVLANLKKIENTLANLNKIQPNIWPSHTLLNELSLTLRELHQQAEKWESPDDEDPSKLDSYHTRLALYQRLKQKYALETDGLLELQKARAEQLQKLDDHSALLKQAEEELSKAFANYTTLAKAIHTKREKISKDFAIAICNELRSLDLKQAKFECQFLNGTGEATSPGTYTSTGMHRCEFFFSANPGMPVQSLSKAASGGEISRMMLAIKCALAQKDPVPLLVFDEIDTGIGGETASKVASAMQQLAKHHQVLTVTHLPQIAAAARWQIRVQKQESGGLSRVAVSEVLGKNREDEIGRMLGNTDAKLTLELAKTMLATSQPNP